MAPFTSKQDISTSNVSRRGGLAHTGLHAVLASCLMLSCAEPIESYDFGGDMPSNVPVTPAATPPSAPATSAITADATNQVLPMDIATAAPALWTLDRGTSFLSLVTTKQTDIAEVQTFERFGAVVDELGNATLMIDMASIATNIDLRDERLRSFLFEVDAFPTASATFQVDNNMIATLPVGTALDLPVSASFTLHGASQRLEFTVHIMRLSSTQLNVATTKPLVLNAMDFNMGGGLQYLIDLASLQSISAAVPVDFNFTFNLAPQAG